MLTKTALSLALTVALNSSPVILADYIVLDLSPGDATCAQDNTEASFMVQTDHCLKLPANIPLVNSYMITACTPGVDDTLAVSLSVFTTDDCTAGVIGGKEYTFDSLPSSCHNGTQLSCQTSDPYAVTENWPAFGLYVDDALCALPSLMAAFAPNCNTYTYEDTSYSLDVTCSDNSGASLSLYGTDPAIPYAGNCSGTPSEQRSMVSDQCTSFATVDPITLPALEELMDGSLKDLLAMLQLDSSNMFYYADCQGADNIPGIETNANSGSGSESDDDIDAGMMALYLTAAAVGAALLVVGGFLFMRRQGREESDSPRGSAAGNTMNEDLLKENVA